MSEHIDFGDGETVVDGERMRRDKAEVARLDGLRELDLARLARLKDSMSASNRELRTAPASCHRVESAPRRPRHRLSDADISRSSIPRRA